MSDYQAGDIIKFTRTVEVVERSYRFGKPGWDVRDVQTRGLYFMDTFGSAKVEMVKRVPRMSKGAKPKAGTVLKGSSIQRIWWKRGTIIRLTHVTSSRGGFIPTPNASSLVLAADGTWISLDRPTETYEFEDLEETAKFLLEHVA